jgi:hypothetical protein
MRLTKLQQSAAHAALDTTVFLDGPAGTGKTTAGVRRLRYLLEQGVPAHSILVLVPQKALAAPYQAEWRGRKRRAGGEISIHTIGSLAFEMVDLFWPLVSEEAGFVDPFRRPTFLSLELAQYFMARVLGPEIERNDYFNSVRLSRYRLYSQLLDNLNKAAVVGLPYTALGDRLKRALAKPDVTQQYIYDDAQACVNAFRDFCRQHNLLDFSWQVELFVKHLWQQEPPRRYLTQTFRHLIVDNIEEDNPATHGILGDWLGECDSALVIFDSDAGYRRFLGADPKTAKQLKVECAKHITLTDSYVMEADMARLDVELQGVMIGPAAKKTRAKVDARRALQFTDQTYHPQMLNWTADEIHRLIRDEGVEPKNIVILAPLLSDALRFSLMNRLDALGVPARSHRPSRALRDEPASRALLTFARLAHPGWNLPAASFDVTYALMAALGDLDLTRGRLLTEIVYRKGVLGSFEIIRADVQARITYTVGERYQALAGWLEAYRTSEPQPLDIFFSRLFGEVLSQPGFGFHQGFDDARAAADLIDSARAFRWTVNAVLPEVDAGQEYLQMVEDGLLADQYVRDWVVDDSAANSVLLAPAYTFLMSNCPVEYQFWLTIGSGSWGQRLYQPLTHPYVLSREWDESRVWTDADEEQSNKDALYRLVSGLVRRCKTKIYLGYSQFGEQGYEQRGPLLENIQRLLRG